MFEFFTNPEFFSSVVERYGLPLLISFWLAMRVDGMLQKISRRQAQLVAIMGLMVEAVPENKLRKALGLKPRVEEE